MKKNTLIKLFLISMLSFFLAGIFLWQGIVSQADTIGQIKQVVLANIPFSFTEPIVLKTSNAAILKSIPKTVYLQAKVTRVINGNTIEISINNQTYKLKYIGVNASGTADSQNNLGCFAKEATNENKRIVLDKVVYIEKDVLDTDQFNRLLRYVYLKLSDGSYLFVNDYLVRAGFTYVDTDPEDIKYQERFLQAQDEAEINNRGLWSKCQTK